MDEKEPETIEDLKAEIRAVEKMLREEGCNMRAEAPVIANSFTSPKLIWTPGQISFNQKAINSLDAATLVHVAFAVASLVVEARRVRMTQESISHAIAAVRAIPRTGGE